MTISTTTHEIPTEGFKGLIQKSNGKNLLVFSKIKLARTDETQKLLAFGERLIQELTLVYEENKALMK